MGGLLHLVQHTEGTVRGGHLLGLSSMYQTLQPTHCVPIITPSHFVSMLPVNVPTKGLALGVRLQSFGSHHRALAR